MCPKVSIYFSETSLFTSRFDDFRELLSYEENHRADQLQFETMRQTYIISHGLLRMLLGEMTGLNPAEINILKDGRNKPYIRNYLLHFNLSHTRNAFAIAICPDFPVGIDLENVNRDLDYSSIAEMCLNFREQMYVEENMAELCERFFLLWTRKEAYLKAVGTGITCDLRRIPSFQRFESPGSNFYEDMINIPPHDSYFVYSQKISDYFLSIATPGRIKIQTSIIDEAYCEKRYPVTIQ
ncbi:MAG TPA: 4'-phosphopantetheinyl transferase superfamily protein [Bacteroidales bacterium]|nr:4'-phosphopantetheinyl transferase superfamily protein [Bacteroidales bacterium]